MDDDLLFQWGVGEELITEDKFFYLDFTWQFSIHHKNDNYDRMEQLNCTLKYHLNSKVDIPLGNFWSYEKVELTKQFNLGMNKYQPFIIEICQGQV